jgi:PAT family beta-lactamase induction signal transducer AmpG
VAQGLPIGLITVAMPAWLAASGASAGEVASFIAITTLPWGFKLFAGPVMDRFRFPALGGRRPWVMLAQSGLLVSLLVLALAGGTAADLAFLTWSCFVINSFAAVQDVAVDGMAIDVLPEDERGRANALMAFGQVAGYAGAGALCGWLLVRHGVSLTAGTMALGVGVILLLVTLLRERDGEKLLPWTAGSVQHEEHLHTSSWKAIGVNLTRVMVLPMSLLLMLVTVCWRLSDGIFITAIPVVLTQEFGWSSSDYSTWYSNSSFVAALCGVLLGPFIDRHGPRNFFVAGFLACFASYLVLALMAGAWDEPRVWIIGMFAVNFSIQIVFVAFIALHMSICWPKVAATQFAIYMAWSNLCRSFGAKAYGELSPWLEAGQETLIMAGLSLAGAVLLVFVRLEKHRERLARLQAREPSEDALADVPARF